MFWKLFFENAALIFVIVGTGHFLDRLLSKK